MNAAPKVCIEAEQGSSWHCVSGLATNGKRAFGAVTEEIAWQAHVRKSVARKR